MIKKKKEQKIKSETVRATFNLIEENKIDFCKIANLNFMNFTTRLNYLIKQDIENNKHLLTTTKKK